MPRTRASPPRVAAADGTRMVGRLRAPMAMFTCQPLVAIRTITSRDLGAMWKRMNMSVKEQTGELVKWPKCDEVKSLKLVYNVYRLDLHQIAAFSLSK